MKYITRTSKFLHIQIIYEVEEVIKTTEKYLFEDMLENYRERCEEEGVEILKIKILEEAQVKVKIMKEDIFRFCNISFENPFLEKENNENE